MVQLYCRWRLLGGLVLGIQKVTCGISASQRNKFCGSGWPQVGRSLGPREACVGIQQFHCLGGGECSLVAAVPKRPVFGLLQEAYSQVVVGDGPQEFNSQALGSMHFGSLCLESGLPTLLDHLWCRLLHALECWVHVCATESSWGHGLAPFCLAVVG